MSEVLIFPTDTVYGIGAKLLDKNSINKIYEIKGRDFNKPLAVLCSNIKQIEEFAVIDKKLLLLAKLYWPGGLSLVLKTNDYYFNLTGESTIAVRIPNHQLALKLLDEYGPMKTTSVNQSGEAPLNDYEVIYSKYKDMVDKIYPNNEKIEGVSSTVVDLTGELKILREGNITKDDIFECLKVLE